MHIPIGTGNTERLIRAIETLKPEAVVLTPSYAAHLAESHDLRESSVRRVLVAGEPGGGEPAFRAKLEEGWGAKVTEAMGVGDIGPSLFGECEQQDGMHLGAHGFVHMELIDPETGEARELEDGAEGELVLTHLQHRAAPLIRFRTRDHVVVRTSPCACGRTGPRIRCVGRTDDMLIVRGVNVFPSAIREVVNEFAPHVSGHILVRPRSGGRETGPTAPGHASSSRLTQAQPRISCKRSLADCERSCRSERQSSWPPSGRFSEASTSRSSSSRFASRIDAMPLLRGRGDLGGTKYRMREKIFAIGDDYWVEDDAGDRAFKVDGKVLRLRDTLLLKDPSGAELYKVQKKLLHIRNTMQIERGGDTVATVKKALITPFRERFSIAVEGGEDMEAKGNIVDHEYKIERGGEKVAEVSKRWFRVRDTYGIEVAPEPGRRADHRGHGLHRPDDARLTTASYRAR